jgi:hypothetical protein
MAERILGGQSLGQSAIVKGLAVPANSGAEADLAGGAGGLARDQLAAHGGQRAQNGVAQPVAQKLASSGAGSWRMPAHISAIFKNLIHLTAPGLPSFVQALTFFVCLINRQSLFRIVEWVLIVQCVRRGLEGWFHVYGAFQWMPPRGVPAEELLLHCVIVKGQFRRDSTRQPRSPIRRSAAQPIAMSF